MTRYELFQVKSFLNAILTYIYHTRERNILKGLFVYVLSILGQTESNRPLHVRAS